VVRQVRTTAREPGWLAARPAVGRHAEPPADTGLLPLGLDGRRDGIVYVPPTYQAGAPLSVKLHGAGGHGRAALEPFLARADAAGVLLLGIDSRGPTWDLIRGGFGADVTFLDAALDRVFTLFSVDPNRVSIEGFSDGASYALSLGLANGELFSKIVAFSPGFLAPGRLQGRPDIFVSHGVHDRVLPIDRCSRRLVPELRVAGYSVDYREFDGGHTVPEDVAAAAEAWVTA
jgi:phospholipase/carboxylesterase